MAREGVSGVGGDGENSRWEVPGMAGMEKMGEGFRKQREVGK